MSLLSSPSRTGAAPSASSLPRVARTVHVAPILPHAPPAPPPPRDEENGHSSAWQSDGRSPRTRAGRSSGDVAHMLKLSPPWASPIQRIRGTASGQTLSLNPGGESVWQRTCCFLPRLLGLAAPADEQDSNERKHRMRSVARRRRILGFAVLGTCAFILLLFLLAPLTRTHCAPNAPAARGSFCKCLRTLQAAFDGPASAAESQAGISVMVAPALHPSADSPNARISELVNPSPAVKAISLPTDALRALEATPSSQQAPAVASPAALPDALPDADPPFTLVSLLRDMPSEEDLLASASAMNATAYRELRVQHAIQWNSLTSWMMLRPRPEIILFMDTSAACSAVQKEANLSEKELKCFVVPCWHPQFRKPLMDCLFHMAHTHAKTELVAFVNGDIVLAPTLPSVVRSARKMLPEQFKGDFMLVSRRTGVFFPEELLEAHHVSHSKHVERLLGEARAFNGSTTSWGYAIDLFIYPRSLLERLQFEPRLRAWESQFAGLYPASYDLSSPGVASLAPEATRFPPFLAGVYRWDNWLLSQMILSPEVRVVDLSPATTLVHQMDPREERIRHGDRRGAGWNDGLAKRISGRMYRLGNMDHADLIMRGSAPCDAASPCTLEANGGASIEVLLWQRSTSLRRFGGEMVRGPSEDAGTAVADKEWGRPVGGWVVLVHASGHDAPYVRNWACWAERNEFTHFVFLAQDASTARLLSSLALPFLAMPSAPEASTAPPGSEELPALLWRLSIIRSAIESLSIVSVSARTVWPRASNQFFHWLQHGPRGDSHRDFALFVRALSPGAVPAAKDKAPKIDASILVLKTHKHAAWAVFNVIKCVESTGAPSSASAGSGSTPSKVFPSRMLLDSCLGEVAYLARGNWKRGNLDWMRFPRGGREYLLGREPQAHGFIPPWIVELSADAERFEGGEQALWGALGEWGLIATSSRIGGADKSTEAEQGLQCIPLPSPPPFLPPPPLQLPAPGSPKTRSASQNMYLTIRVLTFNRLEPLQRLLASLVGAEYNGDVVGLVISVDRPSDLDKLRASSKGKEDKPLLLLEWEAVLASCRAFKSSWVHGAFQCLEQEEHIGLAGQWTSWTYPDESQDADPAAARALVAVFEDDMEVSPLWYSWLSLAVSKYFFQGRGANFDPRLFGIALHAQRTILGEDAQHRYDGEVRTPAHLLGSPFNASAAAADAAAAGGRAPFVPPHLYLFQQVGTWGSVFFPPHWRLFQAWLREKQFDPLTGSSSLVIDSGSGKIPWTPCVPGLISNEWWAAKKSGVWSAWFLRFAFEKGLYSLYTNFPSGQALAVNHRSAGVHFGVDKGVQGSLLSKEGTKEGSAEWNMLRQFPDLATLPLFDFHFRRIHTRGRDWIGLMPLFAGPEGAMTSPEEGEIDPPPLPPMDIRCATSGASAKRDKVRAKAWAERAKVEAAKRKKEEAQAAAASSSAMQAAKTKTPA